jgi:hypothetical protein
MKKLLKTLSIGTLTLATIVGSFYGHENDFPPLYSNKTGTSTGVCLSIFSRVEKGAIFNGSMISLFSNNNGKINGANVSFVYFSDSSKNSTGKLNGINISAGNAYQNINGVDISFISCANNINGVQIGGVLRNQKRKSLFLNYSFIENSYLFKTKDYQKK